MKPNVAVRALADTRFEVVVTMLALGQLAVRTRRPLDTTTRNAE